MKSKETQSLEEWIAKRRAERQVWMDVTLALIVCAATLGVVAIVFGINL